MTPPPSSHTHPPLSPPTLALPARRQASSSKRLLRRREAQGHPLVTVSWSPRPRKPHLAARVAHAHDQHPRPRPRPHPAHAHAHITAASHAPPTPRHHATTSPRHHATTSRCPALRPSVASRAAQWAYWALPGQHSRAPRSASRAAAPQACRVAHNPLRPHSRPRCTFSCASHTVLPPPLPPLFPLAVPCPAPWMPTAPSSATRHDT